MPRSIATATYPTALVVTANSQKRKHDVDEQDVFSPDYFAARDRFRAFAQTLGWSIESHAIDARGPAGEELTIDVAVSSGAPAKTTLVLSSGLHGIEGFFGSAVQLAAMQAWFDNGSPPVRVVLLHALNPYGFAWQRRFDEHNVDPNRNFLLPDEDFTGAPDGYHRLNQFLNPECPPSRWEPVTLVSMYLIARHGLPTLKQAIATGQYEYPRGLFFGGQVASQSQRILAEQMPIWLAGSEDVVHLDFHTGLGPHATHKLLIDYSLTPSQRDWLVRHVGRDAFEESTASSIAYDARGGFGRWCVHQQLAPNYLFACAEFGTYGPVPVLKGLRSENQAHHWGEPNTRSTHDAKQRLKELFCPANEAWRSRVISAALDIVTSSVCGLVDIEGGGPEPIS